MAERRYGVRAFNLTTTIGRPGSPVYWPVEIAVPVECTEAQAVEHIVGRLRREGVVQCTRLRLRGVRGRPAARAVVARTPGAIGVGLVGLLSPFHYELVEARDLPSEQIAAEGEDTSAPAEEPSTAS
jgi:hypothetical protein